MTTNKRIIGDDIDLIIADKMASELEEEIFNNQMDISKINLDKDKTSLFLESMKYLLQKGSPIMTESMHAFGQALNILYMRGYSDMPGFDLGAVYGTLQILK